MQLTAGHWAGDGTAGRDRPGHRRKRRLRGRRTDRRRRRSGPSATSRSPGIAKFGSVPSLGGATIAVFTVPEAQRLLDKEGRVDLIFVAARPGVSPRAGDRPDQADPARRRPGPHRRPNRPKKTPRNVNDFLQIIRYFLLAFAGIAVLVGAFVTFNTISITVAQRVREFATLRSLGASRRQVLRSVLVEGFCIGVLASVVGLFAGLGLAKGLNALFDALGLSLPTTSLVLETRTVIVSLLLGSG